MRADIPVTVELTGISSFRLESQMTSDIQAILQLLQRQTAAGPPAYSTVTSSPDYQRTTLRGQSEAVPLTDLSLAPVQPRLQVSSSLDWGGRKLDKENVPERVRLPWNPCLPQSSEPALNQPKEASSALMHAETLPDQNFSRLLESDAPTEQRAGPELADQQQPSVLASGRQASLPDVPNTSGMLGLYRPVSDPGLPGK